MTSASGAMDPSVPPEARSATSHPAVSPCPVVLHWRLIALLHAVPLPLCSDCLRWGFSMHPGSDMLSECCGMARDSHSRSCHKSPDWLCTMIVLMPNTNISAAPRYWPIGKLLFTTSGKLLKAVPMPTLMTVMMDKAAVEPSRLHHLPTCTSLLSMASCKQCTNRQRPMMKRHWGIPALLEAQQ